MLLKNVYCEKSYIDFKTFLQQNKHDLILFFFVFYERSNKKKDPNYKLDSNLST